MATIKVLKATQEHIDGMKGKLREEDVKEVWLSSRLDADWALQHSFELSHKAWVAVLDDEPVCAFGVGPLNVLSTTGSPWLLGTDKVKEIKYTFLKNSRPIVAEMLEGYDLLENDVHEENTISKEWLKWCGFKLEEPKPLGHTGALFRRFTLTRK